MDQQLATLLADLEKADQLSGVELNRSARRANWFAEFTASQLADFLDAVVAELPLPLSPAADRLLAAWLVAAVQARRKSAGQGLQPPSEQFTAPLHSLERLYDSLDESSRARGQLLAWLSTSGTAYGSSRPGA